MSRESGKGWKPQLQSRGAVFDRPVAPHEPRELDPSEWRERLRNPWRWLYTISLGKSRLDGE